MVSRTTVFESPNRSLSSRLLGKGWTVLTLPDAIGASISTMTSDASERPCFN